MNITGTFSRRLDDGREVECEWMVDTEEQTIVQMGGEGELVAEDVDMILAMLDIKEPTPNTDDLPDDPPDDMT